MCQCTKTHREIYHSGTGWFKCLHLNKTMTWMHSSSFRKSWKHLRVFQVPEPSRGSLKSFETAWALMLPMQHGWPLEVLQEQWEKLPKWNTLVGPFPGRCEAGIVAKTSFWKQTIIKRRTSILLWLGYLYSNIKSGKLEKIPNSFRTTIKHDCFTLTQN